jgi:hypothetical protein
MPAAVILSREAAKDPPSSAEDRRNVLSEIHTLTLRSMR